MKPCKINDLAEPLRSRVLDAIAREDQSRVSSPSFVVGKVAFGPPANPPKPEPRRRREPNKTETNYRKTWLETRKDIASIRYEGLTFRFENTHAYTPDFVVVTTAGTIECHEVKGTYRFGSHQRARLAFDQARVEWPMFKWVWWTKGQPS